MDRQSSAIVEKTETESMPSAPILPNIAPSCMRAVKVVLDIYLDVNTVGRRLKKSRARSEKPEYVERTQEDRNLIWCLTTSHFMEETSSTRLV